VPGGPVPPVPHGLPGIEIGELVGQGGMGRVYKARHVRLNRLVAVKVMAPSASRSDDAHKRFEREMQVLAQLDHPNIVRIHHADEAGGVPYLVMDFLEGVSLADHVRLRGPLPVAEACALTRQAALGLQHAHDRGMVHRDVKPGNLLLTRDGVLKILDLGLARWAEGGGEETVTGFGVVMGTPGYVAPEQVSDARSAGPAADVFSLGCTFYYLLTGACPFPGESTAERLQALGKMSPKPLAEVRPDCPQEVLQMVATMMDRIPACRGSAGWVAERLRPPAHGERPERRSPGSPTRRPLMWAAVVSALVGGALALALWLSPGQEGAKGPTAEAEDGKVGEVANMSGANGPDLVRFSPATGLAVTAETEGALRIWSLEKRRLLNSWGRVTNRPLALAVFTPDGRSVVTPPGLVLSNPLNGEQGGKLIADWKDASVHDMSFSADGKRFLTAKYDGSLLLWTLPAGKLYREFKHGTNAVAACLTSDGKFILSGGTDGVVRLWDIEKDRQETTYEGHGEHVEFLGLLADGKRFVSGSLTGKVIVWDLKNGKQLHKLSLENKGSYDYTNSRLALAPAGRRLVAGHVDGSISVWDLDKGERVSTLTGHKQGWIRAVDVTPDGRYALSVGSVDGQLVRYWRLPPVPAEHRVLPEAIKKPEK
jgi:hypothetical protein